MPGEVNRVLVSVVICTYNSARWIRETLDSVLAQTFQDFEIVVVDDGSTDRTAEIVASYGDPRIRWIAKEHGGIPDSFNRSIAEARGELIARIGHDDVMDPYRLELQVAAMRKHPEVGVVHTDALTIDGHGRQIGRWESADYSKEALDKLFFRVCNNIIDPSTMVRKAVYDEVGGYDLALPMCNDFDFWIRAAQSWRFKHLPLKLTHYRRHGGNFSDEKNKAIEKAEVEIILERMVTKYRTLQDLVPEVDWTQSDADELARGVACELLIKRGHPDLADRLFREPPGTGVTPALPGAAQDTGMTRASASGAVSEATPRRILMVMYGWAESGGGTILPRSIAKELVKRGHDVQVFYAGVKPMAGKPAYHAYDHVEDGVRLRGIFNRPHVFMDLEEPLRDVEDSRILAEFRRIVDEFQPEVVHVHNLHNLSAAIAVEIGRRGLQGFFTPHNYWLVCPRLYLFRNDLSLCEGPGTGARCGECVGQQHKDAEFAMRRAGVRQNFIESGLTCLAVSGAVRDVLIANGFPPDRITVLFQGHQQADRLWQEVGAHRSPRTPGGPIVFSFIGSAMAHKGVHLLVMAAQEVKGAFEVRIHGDSNPAYEQAMRALDKRGVVRFMGPYAYGAMSALLRATDVAVIPSVWYDNAPLAVNECLAARVPVLGANMGGIPEFLQPGVDGDVFRGCDADDLARKMQEIVDRPEMIAQWQSNITQPGSFERYITTLEALYSSDTTVSRDLSACGPTLRPSVAWEGTQFAYHSLAHVNRRVVTELLDRGEVDVSIVPFEDAEFEPGDDPTLKALAAAHLRPMVGPPNVHVRHMWPPKLDPPPSGAWVMLQPWEYGCIPEAWVRPIREGVDEVWVPSAWSKAAYVKAGIPEERIVIIPNGIDPAIHQPEGPTFPVSTRKRFKFLFVGGTIGRKGIDALINAFGAAFKADDDVCLVLKASGLGSFYRDSAIGDQIERLRKLPGSPEIEIVDRNLTDAEVAALYRTCDALVTPYRAEGFCMPIAEAMACGLPVIATGYGACLDFADESTAFLVPAQEVACILPKLPPPAIEYTWAEPSVVDLARLMRHVAANPDDARERAKRARERLHSHYSWKQVSELYQQRIRDLACRVPRRFVPDYLDPLHFSPEVQPMEIEGLRRHNILVRPDWSDTAWISVLDKYLRAYSPEDDVALVIRDDSGAQDATERLLSAIENLGYDPEKIPDVVVIDQNLAGNRTGGLYTACQAFVSLGNSRHDREADACGLAIIRDVGPDTFRTSNPLTHEGELYAA
jgi:glycosyltransferase involved in cell wall biosynthesis